MGGMSGWIGLAVGCESGAEVVIVCEGGSVGGWCLVAVVSVGVCAGVVNRRVAGVVSLPVWVCVDRVGEFVAGAVGRM